MTVQVIVLNGGSSSGKSSIARALQAKLARPWLHLGVDTLIQVAPERLWQSADGLVVTESGEIIVGPGFRTLEAAWDRGLAAMAHAGAGLILEQVFLAGGAAQRKWQATLEGLRVLWVGVRCDAATAAAREAARGDRLPGMAAVQAEIVHQGVAYDLEVDTARLPTAACAERIAARLAM